MEGERREGRGGRGEEGRGEEGRGGEGRGGEAEGEIEMLHKFLCTRLLFNDSSRYH